MRMKDSNAEWELDWFDQRELLSAERRKPTSHRKRSTSKRPPERIRVDCKDYKGGTGSKYLYATRKLARRQLRQDSNNGFSTRQVYPCNSCDGYHLSKMTKTEYTMKEALRQMSSRNISQS